LKKVLIIKLGAIGDVVMASSILSAAREKYGTDCNISWICGEIVAPLIKLFNNIDDVIVINEKKLLTGNLFEKLSVLLGVWTKFFGKRYDEVLIPYFDKRYRLLALTLRTPKLKTFDNANRINTFVKGRYFADEYAKLISEVDDFRMQRAKLASIVLHEADEKVRTIIKSLPKPTILIAPAGAKNLINYDSLRRWPIENYVELVKLLNQKNITPILIGSEGDKWAEDYFNSTNYISLIGKTSLTELLYIYTKSNLLITHDTGTMHLAKLTSLNVIALFGPTEQNRFIDKNDTKFTSIFGGNELYCAPCYDGKNFADCKNNICMKNISAENVLAKVNGILR